MVVVGFKGLTPEPCTMVPGGTWQVKPGRSNMLKFCWGSDQIEQKWTKFCSLFCSFLGLIIYAATPHICNCGQQTVTIVTTSAWHNLKWMKLCRSRFGFRYKKRMTVGYGPGPVTPLSDSVGYGQKYTSRAALWLARLSPVIFTANAVNAWGRVCSTCTYITFFLESQEPQEGTVCFKFHKVFIWEDTFSFRAQLWKTEGLAAHIYNKFFSWEEWF